MLDFKPLKLEVLCVGELMAKINLVDADDLYELTSIKQPLDASDLRLIADELDRLNVVT